MSPGGYNAYILERSSLKQNQKKILVRKTNTTDIYRQWADRDTVETINGKSTEKKRK